MQSGSSGSRLYGLEDSRRGDQQGGCAVGLWVRLAASLWCGGPRKGRIERLRVLFGLVYTQSSRPPDAVIRDVTIEMSKKERDRKALHSPGFISMVWRTADVVTIEMAVEVTIEMTIEMTIEVAVRLITMGDIKGVSLGGHVCHVGALGGP